MLTIEKLEDFGANPKDGLSRCINNQELYFRLINKLVDDMTFDNLKMMIEKKNYDKAFELSHSLKGVLANLSLTPLYDIVYELTEKLRNKEDIDYNKYIIDLFIKRDELISICK